MKFMGMDRVEVVGGGESELRCYEAARKNRRLIPQTHTPLLASRVPTKISKPDFRRYHETSGTSKHPLLSFEPQIKRMSKSRLQHLHKVLDVVGVGLLVKCLLVHFDVW